MKLAWHRTAVVAYRGLRCVAAAVLVKRNALVFVTANRVRAFALRPLQQLGPKVVAAVPVVMSTGRVVSHTHLWLRLPSQQKSAAVELGQQRESPSLSLPSLADGFMRSPWCL
jgi:hypothetical protein